MDKEQVSAYLKRINFSEEPEPSLDVLTKLQKAHLLNIPFENLDIHYGIPIKIDVEKIYNKIIMNRRGGFCYELNGMYFLLLKSLGFEVKRISARVYSNEKDFSPEYDHLAVIAIIDQVEYLTDVGFREFAFSPLKLELSTIQHDARGNYRFDQFDSEYLQVSRITDTEKIPEYLFKNKHREFKEFASMCDYQQYDSTSHFRKQKLISRPTEAGRITLTSNKLKLTQGKDFKVQSISGAEEFEKELWNHFNIKMNE